MRERLTKKRIVYWGAWPNANQQKKTADEDWIYKNVLGGKQYMMGVSPQFYTSEFIVPYDSP